MHPVETEGDKRTIRHQTMGENKICRTSGKGDGARRNRKGSGKGDTNKNGKGQ